MKATVKYRLTKSTFTYGKQCLKRLYLHKNHKRLDVEKDVESASVAARLEMGTRTGELARGRFPGGLDCTPHRGSSFADSIAMTMQAIADKSYSVLYEAAFQADEVFAALDILLLREDGWHAIEVKSTKSVEPQHISDAAIQYWVVQRTGIRLISMSIMHLNDDYERRDEDINIHELFRIHNITGDVISKQNDVTCEVQRQLSCLDIEDIVPDVSIGDHCNSPYPCDFQNHCWKQAGVPEYSVLNLYRGGKKCWQLYHKGVVRIEDIDQDAVKLTPTQRLQVECARTGRIHIYLPEIEKFVSSISYPIYFLDFETIAPAVPIFPWSRCYQAIAFQYSIHIQDGPALDGNSSTDDLVSHKEFIGDGSQVDPRPQLLSQMLHDIGDTGSVMVYNKSFEDARLKEMARDFPEYAESIGLIRARLVDLAIPFQNKHYYTAAMKGKYSIKYVLPAVCPDYANSYKELDIQEGLTASNTYLKLVESHLGNKKPVDEIEKLDLLRKLLDYCKLDTLAMVKIFEVLCRITINSGTDECGREIIEDLKPLKLEEEF